MDSNVCKSPEIYLADVLEKIDIAARNSDKRHVALDVGYSLYMISLEMEASPQLDAIDESIQLICDKGQGYSEQDFLAITCMTCLEMTYGFELLSNPKEAFHNLYLDSGILAVLKFLAQYLENLNGSSIERLQTRFSSSGFWIDKFLQSVFESPDK
jgi:hypothetical protein